MLPELTELLELLRANHVTYYKSGDLELHLTYPDSEPPLNTPQQGQVHAAVNPLPSFYSRDPSY